MKNVKNNFLENEKLANQELEFKLGTFSARHLAFFSLFENMPKNLD